MQAVAGLLMVLVCGTAYGQVAEQRPAFEVASIKPSAPPDYNRGMRVGTNGGPGTNDPGRFTCENLDLVNLVILAYDIQSYQLTAPDWLRNERFDIVAKVPEGASKEQVPLMLQDLLIERFKLAVHHEKKQLPAYDLMIGKNGPKLKESQDDLSPAPTPQEETTKPALGQDGFPVLPPGKFFAMTMMNDRARMRVVKTSMEDFAVRLSGQTGRPVIDATGLKGKYDFTLSWVTTRMRAVAPDGATPATSTPDDAGPTLFGALQEQLGLKLEPRKELVDTLVIDHIEKVPTEN